MTRRAQTEHAWRCRTCGARHWRKASAQLCCAPEPEAVEVYRCPSSACGLVSLTPEVAAGCHPAEGPSWRGAVVA